MVLTGLMVWLWLRRKRLPVLAVLDAWAPCGALLAAVLSVAHFVEGTDAGMPTRLPWGVVTPGDTVLGRVHPVQIYSAVAWLALCLFLLRKLRERMFAGEVVALALIVGGALSFLLDILRQPVETYGTSWLEPGQCVALAAMLTGGCIYIWPRSKPKLRLEPNPKPELTRTEVALILENFASGKGGTWDWDIYIAQERFSDPFLAHIQGHCTVLPEEFPTTSGWCNEQGIEVIREYARQLRSDGEQSKKELA
jgi:hypothetical protein